ncbi:MAG TPA: hypothetical protein VLA19_22100 [Herpetosiphonaceae bacterium]|nr:hypothetical protein [Herpetosiphonaceae bacterium]
MSGINYDVIKALAKERGCKVTDLIALAPQNDPFYAGTPSDRALGEWFKDLWHRFGYSTGVHIRRVHYQTLSQKPSVFLPNGTPYENTEACWDTLSMASKAARYLELIDPGAFVDRRNPEAALYVPAPPVGPSLEIDGQLWDSDTDFPDFPGLPDYAISGYAAAQPYHIEVWCEKSTMNDVLIPLCQRYGANLQTGVGELSITATLAMVRRLEASGKPARIFYVSDFDPAGQSMPVAVARKAEYFIRNEGLNIDMRLFPVVMTADQVRHYDLPRTPIKETERRRGSFEHQHGTGAVELDALEALYPGELDRLLSGYIKQYYDTSLGWRVSDAQMALRSDLDIKRLAIIERHAAEIAALKQTHESIRAEFAARMEDYRQRLADVWQAISDDLEAVAPDLDDYPIPEGHAARELGEGLFNSSREYIKQLSVYKAHQGKGVVSIGGAS